MTASCQRWAALSTTSARPIGSFGAVVLDAPGKHIGLVVRLRLSDSSSTLGLGYELPRLGEGMQI